MDENLEDAFNEASKQYEGVELSRNERIARIDMPDLAAQAFVNMIGDETQINRAIYDFCRFIEYHIDEKWLDQDVHVEYCEGQMTKFNPDFNDGRMVLDIPMFFNAISDAIQLYIEMRKSEIEREDREMGL